MKFLVYFPCRIYNKDLKVSNVVVNLEASYVWGNKYARQKENQLNDLRYFLNVIPNDYTF